MKKDSRESISMILFFPGVILMYIGGIGIGFGNPFLIFLFCVGIIMTIIGIILRMMYWNDKNKNG